MANMTYIPHTLTQACGHLSVPFSASRKCVKSLRYPRLWCEALESGMDLLAKPKKVSYRMMIGDSTRQSVAFIPQVLPDWWRATASCYSRKAQSRQVAFMQAGARGHIS